MFLRLYLKYLLFKKHKTKVISIFVVSMAILTEIEVFGGEKLTLNQSGLTTPHNLLNISEEDAGKQVHIHYKIDRVPNFEYELKEK